MRNATLSTLHLQSRSTTRVGAVSRPSSCPVLCLLLALGSVAPDRAQANCDLIPQKILNARGALGSVDRPYASVAPDPGGGQVAEGDAITLRLSSGDCPTGGIGAPTFFTMFVEEVGGTAIYVLPTDPVLAVQWLAGIGHPTCTSGSGTPVGGGLAESGGLDRFVLKPFFSSSGGATRIVASNGIPCDLAAQRCVDVNAATVSACVDELYEADGTCGTAPANRARFFSHFTMLPPPNDYAAICTSAEPGTTCQGNALPVRIASDADGNLIIPFDYSGVRLDPDFPTPRLVRFRTDVDSFPGNATPVQLPGPDFYDSFSLRGQLLPPFFDEVDDGTNVPKFIGTVDAPRGIVRFARRSPVFRECRDGGGAVLSPGVPCAQNSDCPSGASCGDAVCYVAGVATATRCDEDADCAANQECGPSLFDFSTRSSVAAANYTAEALNPVPLDALISSDDAILTVRSEPLESNLQGADLNGDFDTDDVAVVSLRNPKTGDTVPIGKVPTGGGPRAVGSATGRVVELAGAFPTATLEGDLTGFIDTANGDKLGVVRLDDGAPEGFVDLSPASAPRVDPTPEVGGEPIAISNGLVFFREYEQAAAIISKVDRTSADPNVYANKPIYGYDNYSVLSDISITPNGRYIAYTSTATNIAGGFLNTLDLYVLDRDTDADGILDEAGATANLKIPGISYLEFASVRHPDISADGRFVVFENQTMTGGFVIIRLDRDMDQDGVFDECNNWFTCVPSPIITVGNGNSYNPSISDDGDRIAFASDSTNLGFTDTNGVRDVFVFEISTGDKRWARGQSVPNGPSDNPEISGDGLWIAYETDATNHVSSGANDTNGTTDALVFGWPKSGAAYPPVYLSAIADPFTGTNVVGNGRSSRPGLSRDGRFAVFASKSTNLGGGEFLSQSAFLVDRDPDRNGSYGGTATRIRSIPFPNTWDVWPRLSPDGGSISLSASVDTFGPDPSLTNISYGLMNRATGLFRNGFTTKDDGGFPPEVAPLHAVSEGGRDWAVLENPCTSFFQGLCITRLNEYHARLSGLDRADASGDRNGDGDSLDSVLSLFDPATSTLTAIAPSGEAAVADGHAVFLLSEANENATGGTPGSFPVGCQGTALAAGCDLNADGDARDSVAHLFRPSPLGVENLGMAALRVDLDDGHIVVVESNGAAPHVKVRSRDGVGAFLDLGLGFRGEVTNGRVVVYTSERDAGDLNGDGDSSDDVIALYDANSGAAIPFLDVFGAPLGKPDARDFVLGETLLAFRSSERNQGQTDLNGDGDEVDDVLRVVDLATGHLLETRQAAIRCPIEACDPDLPYRIAGDTVVFLTPEQAQSDRDGQQLALAPGCLPTGQTGQCDLDGDGSARGVVIQYYNAARALAAGNELAGLSTAAVSSGGSCTDTGEGCLEDDDCSAGRCIVTPGICAGPTGANCNPNVLSCQAVQGFFCEPSGPTTGQCFEYSAPCSLDSDCAAGESCFDAETDIRRPSNPLASRTDDGGLGFLTRGACVIERVTSCTSSGDCDGTDICNQASGNCEAREATCRSNSECPDGFTCKPTLVFGASADADGDGIADLFDLCPDRTDPAQADLDGDGIGDACDRETCGNGVQEYDESCDDGNQTAGDGCSDLCVIEGATPACSNGRDDDGDGLIDFPADPGCTDASDTSERGTDSCDDGIDNDGDYGVDTGGDLACTALGRLETAQCKDGIDNDGDGRIDFDGGVHAHGSALTVPDPHCATPGRNSEKPSRSCGLGAELPPLLLLVGWLWRRRTGSVARRR